MRTLSLVMLTAALLAPRTTAAQTNSQPSVVLTILGGVVTGHSLWSVNKQPMCVFGGGGGCLAGQYDTVRLSRQVSSSLVLGAAGTYFFTPHIGVHLEISYMGLPFDSSCEGPATYTADSDNKNEQICNDIQSQSGNGGAISIFGGMTLRAAPRGSFSPYVRGNIGLVNQSHSPVEVVGGYFVGGSFNEKAVIIDRSPRRNSLLVGAAAGFTSPLGPGYQFRLELRDQMTSIDRVVAPANSLGDAPIATKLYHHIALTLAFDVVLEKSRGRRY